MPFHPRSRTALLLGWFFTPYGCDGRDADTGARLPPIDTSETFREDSGTFPLDTALGSDTADDDTPDHWLTMRQEGTWAVVEGSSMTGELVVTEILDGDTDAPACEATWSLVGLVSAEACEGCLATFDVEHTLVASEGACVGPDLPEDGDVRALGYDGAGIWWDYGGTGVWVPLYDAGPGEEPDTVAFLWEDTAAVTVEDEE